MRPMHKKTSVLPEQLTLRKERGNPHAGRFAAKREFLHGSAPCKPQPPLNVLRPDDRVFTPFALPLTHGPEALLFTQIT